MEIHSFFITFHCLLTASIVLTIALGIGKFFCVEWMEDVWDILYDSFDGVPMVLCIACSVCLIGVWCGYIFEIEILYAISLMFAGFTGVFYWIFSLYTLIAEVIAPVFNQLHKEIRKRKHSRY